MVVSISGHRPTGLWGHNRDPRYAFLRTRLHKEIVRLVREQNAQRFFVGTSLGVDSMALNLLTKLSRSSADPCYAGRSLLTVIAVVPYESQADRWEPEQQERYRRRLELAPEVHYVDCHPDYLVDDAPKGAPHPAKMLARNQYLVDRADLVLVVWSEDERGNTYDLVRRARDAGKELIVVNPFEIVGR